jgi:2-polyprenyl-3-methyl-5-hydroxy-6-metoxy-1,4-benzoquinol methylase
MSPQSATETRDPSYFYERFAGDFDREMNAYEVGKRLRLVYDVALAGAPLEGARLLDAGCGTGLFSQLADERGADVVSLDLGPNLLAEVAKKCDSERVVGSVSDLPFEDESFDFVVCTEVIEHTPEPRRSVAELARVVRPGGTLVVTTPNRVWHPAIRIANALRIRPYEGLENWVGWGELREWIGAEGLELRAMRGFNALPWIHSSLYGLIDRLDDAFGARRPGRAMINMIAVAAKPPR